MDCKYGFDLADGVADVLGFVLDLDREFNELNEDLVEIVLYLLVCGAFGRAFGRVVLVEFRGELVGIDC